MVMTAPSSKPELQAVDLELLGKPIHTIRDNLESIIHASCLTLSNALQSWLKSSLVEVTLNGVNLHTFQNGNIEKNNVTTLRHIGGGTAYLNIDPALLVALADRFYGASIERSEPILTSSDLRLQERVAKLVSQWIAPEEMWTFSPYEFANGMGLNADFTIQFGKKTGRLSLILEGKLIHSLIEQLGLERPTHLGDAFNEKLAATPVKLNVLLSRKTLPLSDVLSLSPNDILPIELLNTVPVSIGGEQLFTGRVAEQDGQLVLILNHD
ncbi:FliM/FliN family flagellar motor switch protein [Enterovibrio sp. ZSDZ35]|uniref:FliM/FliN family flagellar motor switch protein n=1 Tax=Enterovibrio qingdaonensis TaxID=2899818 RepID=A0ABT5QLN2_9GAMM|nr:FliM/FliN family flagellar motor switch protein [Enterovibrio sp. ZSDZ35]MDD1781886.1 FliM/FliN family flagellar motor switch protein [Enterovibrio sp. ZSDZ35]